jgi:hypothetical protein
VEIFDIVEVLTVRLKDNVAWLDAGLVGRRSGEDLLHGDAAAAAVADLILMPT